jgi:hypothetical protein
MTYARVVTANLYAFDGTTLISGALANSFDRSFLDEGNGFGTGSCSLPFDDANVGQLVRGRYITVLIEGTRRFTFKIEGTPEYHQIDTGEEIQQYVTASGRGWGCAWDEFQIYPDGGVGVSHVLDYSYRLFSFASRGFPNITTWVPAIEHYEYFDGITESTRVVQITDTGADIDDPGDDVIREYPAPIGFPWPNAPKNGNGSAPTAVYDPTYWVIAGDAPDVESIGFHFFRGSFTLVGEQEVKFTVTGDNLFTLYLNGVPILGEPSDSLIWMDWHEVTLTLPAGEYVVAAVVENIAADVDYNPAGLLLAVVAMAVYPGDIATTETLSLLTSTAADLVDTHFATEEFPGYSVSQILDVVSGEAQARGCIPQYVGSTVTEFADSNANDWDTLDPDTTIEFLPTFSVRLGATGTEVLNGLHEQGALDWHFKPGTLQLDGFAPTAWSTTPQATFTAGVNITGLERGETKPYANALLIQYAGGFTEWADTAEITAYGSRVEGFLQTDAATEEEAQRLGRVEILRSKVDARSAVLLSVEPTSSADCPYEGFDLFEYITIPAVGGGTENQQVLSIAMTEDEFGFATWRMEVGQRWRAPEVDAVSILRAVGGKTVGSVADHGVAKD